MIKDKKNTLLIYDDVFMYYSSDFMSVILFE